MWKAMQALPEPKLIANDLEINGDVCAIGSVGKARGVDMSKLDPEDYERIAHVFGIPRQLAQEIMWENDEAGDRNEHPERRFARMKEWIEGHLRPVEDKHAVATF